MLGNTPPFLHHSQILRVEYAAITRADRALAWRLFSDWRRWRRYSDFYGGIRWLAGDPWCVGSRLQIELIEPVRTTVDHVITYCAPPDCVAWIDHALGNTMEQWVVFESLGDGSTRIRTWAEMVGPTAEIEGRPVGEIINGFIELWYSRFCADCDNVHDEQCAVVG